MTKGERQTMSKKTLKKMKGTLTPIAAARWADAAYPVEQEDLDEQQQRLRKAAAAGTDAQERPTPATTPELYPAPAAVSPPPLTPLAALWPTPAPAQGSAKPSPAPARKVQAEPVKAAALQAAPAPAAQPAKLPIQSEPTKSPGKAAAVVEASMPPARPKVKVTFVLLDLGAKQVSLSGDFNGWSPNATPMRRDASEPWETTVDLAPGRYQYKFVADGEWIPDPLAHENVWNQHGTLNSVIEVRA
jgi:hypothetical protein